MLKNLASMCLLLIPIISGGSVWASEEKGTHHSYSLIDIGSAAGCIIPTSINASGDVAGYACSTEGGPWHAFLYTDGSMINLGTLGGTLSQAQDINNRGQVVGSSLNGQGVGRAFIYVDGYMNDLGINLGGPSNGALAINERGDILGSATTSKMFGSPPQPVVHAFLVTKGRVTELDILGKNIVEPIAINNRGQILGWAVYPGEIAFLYTNGKVEVLGTLGGLNTQPHGINDRGQVVGMSHNASGDRRPFLYENGTMLDLGISAYDGASAINNSGQIVGSGTPVSTSSPVAFLYEDGSMYELNNLLDASGTGWTILWPRAINDAGQIAAEARDAQGLRHAVILTPAKRHKKEK